MGKDTMKQKHLSIKEHVDCGTQLKDTCLCLQFLIRSLPRKKKVLKQTRRALKALENLRCSLDDILCEDIPPEQDPRNIAVRVYYGPNRLETITVNENAYAHDKFAKYRETN